MTNTKAMSKHESASISPRKMGLVADAVRGKTVADTMRILKFSHKKATDIMVNLVKSAVSNAVNNHGMSKEGLYIEDVQIGPGKTIKKGRIGSKGSFKPIKKRSTNIKVILNTMEIDKEAKK